MIKVLFFDFDGTISDAYDIAVKSLVRTLDEYHQKFDKNKLLKLIGGKMNFILNELKISPSKRELIHSRFYKYFKEGALKGGIKPCIPLNPLWKLSKDYPLIVVSNSETSFLKASIEELKIKGLFKKVYGADKFKTKDIFLKKLFKKFKIKPSEALYIGDRFSDIEYARKAGCVAVAIHNKCSWSDLKTIKKEKPDYIVKDFVDLKKLINSLNKI
tara:strand:+ start:6461 stop:7105 length:645 start_codon:yes stop_codon:yes gene_type:complete